MGDIVGQTLKSKEAEGTEALELAALRHGWLLARVGKRSGRRVNWGRQMKGMAQVIEGTCQGCVKSGSQPARQGEEIEAFVSSKGKMIFLLPLSSSRIDQTWVIRSPSHSKDFLILLSKFLILGSFPELVGAF